MKANNIKVAVVGLMMLTWLYSCVSNKKYEEALLRNKKSEEQLANAEKKLSEEQLNKQMLEATNAEELRKREALLAEREKKLDELKAAMMAQTDAVLNLKQQVCSALKCFSPEELSVKMKDGKLYVSLSDQLLFPSGSDQVNERGKEAIQMLSAVLSASDLEVMVEGHTDSIPINTARNKDNWDLSVHRATSVSRLMVQNGIRPQRIISSGRGEFHPVAANTTVEGKQQNRRTEIILAPKLDKLWKLTEENEGETTTKN
jgi:chemotaxis protein MotB